MTLPLALAELGLIDEYEFIVHPRAAGHGPTLFAGLSKRVDLRLVSRLGVQLRGGGDAILSRDGSQPPGLLAPFSCYCQLSALSPFRPRRRKRARAR